MVDFKKAYEWVQRVYAMTLPRGWTVTEWFEFHTVLNRWWKGELSPVEHYIASKNVVDKFRKFGFDVFLHNNGSMFTLKLKSAYSADEIKVK